MFGQRKIALEKDDVEKRSKTFSTIFTVRFCLFLTIILFYASFIFFFGGTDFEKIIFTCWGVYLLRGMINPVWFLQGVGKYKLLSIFNIVSIVSYITLTFIFINQKDQLPLYILIYTGVPLLISICYFPIVFKYIKIVKPALNETPGIIKESFVYFIPTVAVAIYSMVDKTMLGLFDPTQVTTGLYESTDKLVKVAIAVCTASYTIVRTRMSYLFGLNDKSEFERSYHNVISFSMMLCWPIMFGLIGIAYDFVPLFFGEEFNDVIGLTYFFAAVIPFLTISGLIQAIYIFPYGLQKQMNIYYLIVVAVNILMNLFLIYFFKTVGAIIASIVAEALLAIILIIKARKVIKVSYIATSSIKYIVSSIVMFIFVVLFSRFASLAPIYKVIVEIFCGAIIYFLMCLVLHDSFVLTQAKRVLKKLFQKETK